MSFPSLQSNHVSRWEGVEPKKIEFAIDGLVPIGATTGFVARGGAGKTSLSLLAGTCVGSGCHFLGRFTMLGAAVGIFAEDPDHVLHHRQLKINRHLKIEAMTEIDLRVVSCIGEEDAVLWRDGKPTKAYDGLARELADLSDVRLLVLDNAAVLFDGNENDRGEVTRFIGALNRMAQENDMGVLLTTHVSKSETDDTLHAVSGSTAWQNACRSVIQLKAASNGTDGPTLRVIKSNYAAIPDPIPLQWQDGILVEQTEDHGMVGTLHKHEIDNEFLDLLRQRTKQRRTVSHYTNATNFAPKVFASMTKKGTKRRQFEQALDRLFADGRIEGDAQVYQRGNRTFAHGIRECTQVHKGSELTL